MDLKSIFLGLFLGVLFTVFVTVIVARWAVRNKELLRALIREIYHIDLMPFICTIEGSLNIALAESRSVNPQATIWIQRALDQVKLLKKQVTDAVKKYEDYQ